MKNLKRIALAAMVVAPSIALAGPFYGIANIGAGFSEGKASGNLRYNSTTYPVSGLKKSTTSIFGEVGIGKYVYCDNLRVDLTAIGMGGNNDKRNISISGTNFGQYKVRHTTGGGMLNFSYDFMPGEVFNPYVTAGIGVLRTELELKGAANAIPVGAFLKENSKSKTSIAGRVGAGGAIKVTDGMHVVLGYSYIFKERNLGNIDSQSSASYKLNLKAENIHSATLGFRFIF